MAALVITPEIEADARRLAEATGKTPTEVVADALRAQIGSLQPPRSKRKKSAAEILSLVRSYNLNLSNDLTEDEILGYDEFGVPEQPYLDNDKAL